MIEIRMPGGRLRVRDWPILEPGAFHPLPVRLERGEPHRVSPALQFAPDSNQRKHVSGGPHRDGKNVHFCTF
jgi:hypothetical protein